MTDRELMQMVLKKLDHIWELGVEVESYKLSDDLLPEIKALRDRLAQPEHVHAIDISQERVDETAKDRHEGVGLKVDGGIWPISFYALIHVIEDKLNGKNGG